MSKTLPAVSCLPQPTNSRKQSTSLPETVAFDELSSAVPSPARTAQSCDNSVTNSPNVLPCYGYVNVNSGRVPGFHVLFLQDVDNIGLNMSYNLSNRGWMSHSKRTQHFHNFVLQKFHFEIRKAAICCV